MTPNLDGWTDDERAVSPVIGVILMVAITVILAAVIGTFVLDLGQSAGNSAPQASLSVSADAGTDTVTIAHQGGDALLVNNTRVIVEANGSTTTFEPGNGSLWSNTLTVGEDSPALTISAIGPGDQVTVTVVDTESQRQIFETKVTA